MVDGRINRSESSEPARKRRLISVALLPSGATLGNLLCGVFAILCAMLAVRAGYFDVEPRVTNVHLLSLFPTYIAVGCWLIVLAMVCDALDGRLARMTRTTTEFGAQLDSIADIVSFGAAPSLLLLARLLPLAMPAAGDPAVAQFEWRIGLLGALMFVSCAAIRLARYNAENIEEEASQAKFHGLPSPGAAAGLVALLVLHEDLVFMGATTFGVDWAQVVRWSLGPAAFLLGILMVSRLDYVHVFNRYARRERPLSHLVGLVVLIGIGIMSPQTLLVVLSLAYVLSGVVLNISRRRQVHRALRRVTQRDAEEMNVN